MENKDVINSVEEVTDIMIDIESLGNAGKFVVTEVSFVPFNINKGITFSETYSFSVSICVQDSLEKGFKIDPNAVIEDITVGQQQKVEILKALYRGADILILDEPTAVLTPQEIEELGVILKNLVKEGKSIILITHKLKEVMAKQCSFSIRIKISFGV